MKHFFTFLLMTVAAAFTSYAGVNKYQLDIDHADRVKVSINYQEQTGLQDGVNVFTIDDMPENGIYVSVTPSSSDYGITSVVNKAGTAQPIYSNTAYFYFNSTEEGHYYKKSPQKTLTKAAPPLSPYLATLPRNFQSASAAHTAWLHSASPHKFSNSTPRLRI